MKKKWFLIIFIFLFALTSFDFAFSQTEKIEIYFFYSNTCPHCKKEKEFLTTIDEKYPEIDIKEYEVIDNPENKKILSDFYDKYQVPEKDRGWVPVTFTPNKYFIGFNEQTAQEIEGCLKECLNGEEPSPRKIKIPFLGEIDISKMSLASLAIIFGALDGFNPCAMWVLVFLITLLINTRSRKRMWLIGGTFIAVSGIVYYLLLSAWLNLFLAMSYVKLTRILIGTFALGLGIWQIKTFLDYKGTCPVIDGEDSKFKNKITNTIKSQAEKIAISPLSLGIVGGIILLAFGVNLVEFFCSAGLPAIYTRILSLNQVSSVRYNLYLLLYTFVFMLDDLIVLSLAVITLNKLSFNEKYNYWATLIGGLLILALGILLIFKPEILMFV